MLSEPQIQQMVQIATRNEDPEVTRTLYEVVIRSGSKQGQQSVMKIALQAGSLPHHRLAVRALWCEVHHVEEPMVALITPQQLLRRAPTIAVLMTRLVATRAAPEQVWSVA